MHDDILNYEHILPETISPPSQVLRTLPDSSAVRISARTIHITCHLRTCNWEMPEIAPGTAPKARPLLSYVLSPFFEAIFQTLSPSSPMLSPLRVTQIMKSCWQYERFLLAGDAKV